MASTLVIIDGNSLIHRAFYALPPMKRKDGKQTNAIYGFFTMLFSVIETYEPDYLAVAFDRKEKTFRHEMYDEYKAGRKKTPPELIEQFPLLKSALSELGIKTLDAQGFEADDFLGTISHFASENGVFSYVVTGDRDALQLIGSAVTVLITRKGVSDLEVFDEAHLKEKYALAPAQIIDLKALMGDASDHIPGIPGVGEKTALKLLSQYPTVEELYENLDALPKNKLYEKLRDNVDSAILSKKLATISMNAPWSQTLEELAYHGFDDESLLRVLNSFEFSSLKKRFSLGEKEQKRIVQEIVIDTSDALFALLSGQRAQTIAMLMFQDRFCFAFDTEREYTIPIRSGLFGDGMALCDIFESFVPLWKDQNRTFILHNAKQWLHDTKEAGCTFHASFFDVMVAAYALNPTRRNYSVSQLLEKESLPICASSLFTLCASQQQEVKRLGLEKILYDIELPLTQVLFEMEEEGFTVDTDELSELAVRYDQKIKTLTDDIHLMTGNDSFNIASTKQLGVVLFEELGLPVVKKTKTGYSTDIEVLEKLADKHPVISLIMEYRQLTKLKSTYIDGLRQAARGVGKSKVHTTFQQTATATGRISSTEPNLQNIPVRSEISHEIRHVFVPSKIENQLVSADYSQIELRVLAHIADDSNMKDAFINNQDIHARTAAEVFGVPIHLVTPEMRSSAKAVNFGIVYGISDFGLAKNLGIPKYRAAEYIERYLSEFSGVKNYMERIVEQAKRDGYVRTLFGRIRYIDELASSNYNTRSFGERIAMNTPIQGTAADIIKRAMIDTAQRLAEEKLRSKLILQVHDELIVDADQDEVEQVKQILREAMEGAYTLAVPLKVNIAVGKTWAEAK